MKRPVFLLFLVLCGCQSIPTELPVVEKTPVVEAESGTPLKVAESHRENPILKADYVESVLGAPTVKRMESPSQVWVYAQNSCVLFVYMNQDNEVKHMEIGTPNYGSTEKSSMDCLQTAAKLR